MKRSSISGLSILDGVDNDRDGGERPLVKSWKVFLGTVKAYRLKVRSSKWPLWILVLIGLYALASLLSFAEIEGQRLRETKNDTSGWIDAGQSGRQDGGDGSVKKMQDVRLWQPWAQDIGDRLRPFPAMTPLEDRIVSLREAPVMDPPDWLEWNLQTCSPHRIRKNRADEYHRISHEFWEELNSTSIVSFRNDIITFLSGELHSETGHLNFLTKPREKSFANMWGWRESKQEKELKKSKYGEGRGVVYAAGNSDTVNRVITSLKLLRRLANVSVEALPAEVVTYEEETASVSEEARLQFAELGATLRTVSNSSITKGTEKGAKNYQIKATAMIQSSFKEVLYLDSDNLPVSASFADIFESPGYKRLGALFWPDYWKSMAENPVWQVIGVQCRDEWEIEAGQILIDKEKHLDACGLFHSRAILSCMADGLTEPVCFATVKMQAATYRSNAEEPHDVVLLLRWGQGHFPVSGGDSLPVRMVDMANAYYTRGPSFTRFAFLALRKRWAIPGKFVSPAALASNTQTGRCGHTMVQFDHLGRPFTVHQNILKEFKDPEAIHRGEVWARYITMRDELPASPPINSTEEEQTFVKGDLDCDMLANAYFDGKALAPAPRSVMLRAAYERGLKPGWHGGWGGPPLCIDLTWEDPRLWGTEEFSTWPDEDGSGNPLGILWKDPLNETWWKDDERLRDFEDTFFEVGGEPLGWSIDE